MTIDRALLTDYVLGTLPEEQVKEVENFLRSQPATANWVRRSQDELADFVFSLPAEVVDEAAERRFSEGLRARLRASSRPPLARKGLAPIPSRRSPRWAALGLAAAMGLAAWLILGPLVGSDRTERALARYQEQPGAVTAPLVNSDGNEVGTVVRLEDDRLFLAFDRPADEGVYQLWRVGAGVPESIGVLEGRTLLTDPVADRGDLAVTIEPSGGSPRPTTEPFLLVTP